MVVSTAHRSSSSHNSKQSQSIAQNSGTSSSSSSSHAYGAAGDGGFGAGGAGAVAGAAAAPSSRGVAAARLRLRAGDEVVANWQADIGPLEEMIKLKKVKRFSRWHQGLIEAADEATGTYKVRYVDGTLELGVWPGLVRREVDLSAAARSVSVSWAIAMCRVSLAGCGLSPIARSDATRPSCCL